MTWFIFTLHARAEVDGKAIVSDDEVNAQGEGSSSDSDSEGDRHGHGKGEKGQALRPFLRLSKIQVLTFTLSTIAGGVFFVCFLLGMTVGSYAGKGNDDGIAAGTLQREGRIMLLTVMRQ